MHALSSSGARCLIFGRTFHLLPYFMCANSKKLSRDCADAQACLTFTGPICDKYHNPMSWLKYCLYQSILMHTLSWCFSVTVRFLHERSWSCVPRHTLLGQVLDWLELNIRLRNRTYDSRINQSFLFHIWKEGYVCSDLTFLCLISRQITRHFHLSKHLLTTAK